MADDPDPPRLQRKPSGNSAEALRALLERHGLHELLAEVDRHRGLTLFGACCEAGLRKRPEATGNGSPNMAKTRAFFFNRAFMEGERKEAERQREAERATAKPKRRPRSKAKQSVEADHQRVDEAAGGARSPPTDRDPPDLIAALAEVALMHRAPKGLRTPHRLHFATEGTILSKVDHAAHDRELAAERDRLRRAVEQLEARLHDHPLAHPAVACTTCSSPCAPAAVRELLDVALAARRGETGLDGSSIRKACCKRQLHVVDVRALVG